MIDLQHVGEMVAGAAINIYVAVKVLNARFDALHERVNNVEAEQNRANERIDSILLKSR